MALWIVVAYPASAGAVCYAIGRGWILCTRGSLTEAVVLFAYWPVWNAPGGEGYGEWCHERGEEHATSG